MVPAPQEVTTAKGRRRARLDALKADFRVGCHFCPEDFATLTECWRHAASQHPAEFEAETKEFELAAVAFLQARRDLLPIPPLNCRLGNQCHGDPDLHRAWCEDRG